MKTKTETAHTPTPFPRPWIAELSTIYSIPLQSAKEIDDGEWTDGSIVGSTIHKEDAAFIVRAVNAYEELLEAARRSLPLLQHLEKFLKYQTADKQFYPNREQSDAVIFLLSQAIAKAEGRS